MKFIFIIISSFYSILYRHDPEKKNKSTNKKTNSVPIHGEDPIIEKNLHETNQSHGTSTLRDDVAISKRLCDPNKRSNRGSEKVQMLQEYNDSDDDRLSLPKERMWNDHFNRIPNRYVCDADGRVNSSSSYQNRHHYPLLRDESILEARKSSNPIGSSRGQLPYQSMYIDDDQFMRDQHFFERTNR